MCIFVSGHETAEVNIMKKSMRHNAEEPAIQFCIAMLSELSGQNVTIEHKIYLGGGCINNAVMLVCNTGRFFLKWNSSCAADMFIKEAAGLKEMEQVDNSWITLILGL